MTGGVTLHLPYGRVASVTGPNANPITLVGLRKYSSPLCQPTPGESCPVDGVPVFGSIFAAITAIKKWKYEPADVDSTDVVEIKFK